MAEIGVVIPVYNAEETIDECLKSVFYQTYPELSVIIINDGSKDKSLKQIIAACKNYGKKHPWKIISRENKGVSYTRNEGVQLLNSEYIAFLDADDAWKPEKLEKQMQALRTCGGVVMGCLYHGVASPTIQQYSLQQMLYHNYLFTSTVLAKRAVLQEFQGFDEMMSYSEDYKLWLQICASYPVYVLQEVLAVYDIRAAGNGLSAKKWQMEKAELHNYLELYKTHTISICQMITAASFSLLKFSRRLCKRSR